MHLTDKIRAWMSVNNIDFDTYTTSEMYSLFVKNTTNYNTTYKNFQRILHFIQFGNGHVLGKKKKTQTVMRKCTKCHKDFKTEVDSLRIPYSTRCDKCKEAEKTLTKYYEKLGGVRQ